MDCDWYDGILCGRSREKKSGVIFQATYMSNTDVEGIFTRMLAKGIYMNLED